jgi:hypothetical protein
MAVDNGVLVAGYTVRYLRGLMSGKQRETLDQGLPFRIDDGDGGLAAAS